MHEDEVEDKRGQAYEEYKEEEEVDEEYKEEEEVEERTAMTYWLVRLVEASAERAAMAASASSSFAAVMIPPPPLLCST